MSSLTMLADPQALEATPASHGDIPMNSMTSNAPSTAPETIPAVPEEITGDIMPSIPAKGNDDAPSICAAAHLEPDPCDTTRSPPGQAVSSTASRRKWYRTAFHHLSRHVGAGVICSVAYFDPGNWSVDLAAGSLFGYSLLCVVLLSGVCAAILQVLACRLGCVTGLDLASHCRILFNNHPTRPRLVRLLILYPLYAACELAIICTDLAELLGSAIGLHLLIPGLPLWGGVVFTAVDVLLVLALCGDSRKPSRILEAIVTVLVLGIFVILLVVLIRVNPNWVGVFRGFVPSQVAFSGGAPYTAVGIIGATVMPHALFLGSSLSTMDRVSINDTLPLPNSRAWRQESLKRTLTALFAVSRSWDADAIDRSTPFGQRKNNSIAFIKAHLTHAIVDLVASLLGFATVINSAILIVASAAFFNPSTGSSTTGSAAGIFDAYYLLSTQLGPFAGVLFAVALLCAGQSASITATLAGQIVSEGFIQWKLTPFMRRLITRSLGIVPSAIVAVVFGQQGIDTLLVGSQVVLSFILPFVVLPLVYLTSSPLVMTVRDGDKVKQYHNGRIMTVVGYILLIAVIVANGYGLVQIARGPSVGQTT